MSYGVSIWRFDLPDGIGTGTLRLLLAGSLLAFGRGGGGVPGLAVDSGMALFGAGSLAL